MLTVPRKTVSALVLVALSGCASGGAGGPLPAALTTGSHPQVNVRSQARVGDPILSTYQYRSAIGASLSRSYALEHGLIRFEVPTDSRTIQHYASEGHAYCTTEPRVIDAIVGPWRPACFIDRDSDGKFEGAHVYAAGYIFDLSPPIEYKEVRVPISAPGGFKYEILYNGMDGTTANLTYREYIDNLVRPAFQQDLKYTISKNDERITFRSITINVHGANNDGIIYTVLSGFADLQ